jgi:hypothetical protein
MLVRVRSARNFAWTHCVGVIDCLSCGEAGIPRGVRRAGRVTTAFDNGNHLLSHPAPRLIAQPSAPHWMVVELTALQLLRKQCRAWI